MARKSASPVVAAELGVDAHPVPVEVNTLPAVPGEVKPVPPAAAGRVPAVNVEAPVEYSALFAPTKVESPVPP